MNSNEIYVTFHIGKGGRFNNQGFKTFYSEQNFNQLVSAKMDKLFICNRKNGKFCKPYIHDGNGNSFSLTNDDFKNGLTGILDLDGDYDKYITKNIYDCDDLEYELIKNSHKFKNDLVSEDLIEFINCVTN